MQLNFFRVRLNPSGLPISPHSPQMNHEWPVAALVEAATTCLIRWISCSVTNVSKKEGSPWVHLDTNSLSLKIRITKACKIYQIVWEITDVSYEKELTFHQDSQTLLGNTSEHHTYGIGIIHRCKQCSYLFQKFFNTANQGSNNIRILTERQEDSKQRALGGKS